MIMKKKQNKLIALFILISSFTWGQTTIEVDFEDINGEMDNGDKVVTITFDQPDEIIIAEVDTGNISINGGSDGFITVDVIGGTPSNPGTPYTFELLRADNPYTTAVFNGEFNPIGSSTYRATYSNLTATGDGPLDDQYAIRVTDANGCNSLLGMFQLTEPDPLTFNNAITNIDPIVCNGDMGSITLRVQGGVPNYTYQLGSRPLGSTPLTSFDTIETITLNAVTNYVSMPLTPAEYIVVVNDANGATVSSANMGIFVFNEVAPILFTIGTPTPVSCFGGTDGGVALTGISGGSGTYDYEWTLGGIVVATTPNLINRSVGVYTLTVTDSNGCNDEVAPLNRIVEITQPLAPLAITTPTNGIVPPSGAGASDGSINISVSGGTQPYFYAWSNGATTQDIAGLNAGTYSVTATDSRGCTETFSIILMDPPPLSVTIQENIPVICNGGMGELEAVGTGGVPNAGIPYLYDWFEIVSGTPVSLGITTAIASGLSAGIYRVIITDNNGVTASDDFIVSEPTALQIDSLTSSDVSCFSGNNGTASVTVSGGNNDYTYLWTRAGDPVFSETTNAISNLESGTYAIRIEDATAGSTCFIEDTVLITEPTSPLSIDLNTQTNVAINGQSTGSIDITTSGGTLGYIYSWTQLGVPTFTATTEDISNLIAGTYIVTVTDANFYIGSGNDGCIATETFVITEPLLLEATISETTPLFCNGDATAVLTAVAIGGDGTYSYEWFEVVGGVNQTLNTATPSLSNLSAGEYLIEVTDGAGAFTSDTFTITQPDILEISIGASIDINCFGESTGRIETIVSGGTEPYAIVWENNQGDVVGTNEIITNLIAGTYDISVTDANGCTANIENIELEQPLAPLAITTNSITPLSGFQTNDGAIDISITGGTPNYSFEWVLEGTTNVLFSTEDISNIPAGIYEVTVIDSNGCSMQEIFEITQPELLVIDDFISTDLNQCFGDATTDVQAIITGGVPLYTFAWFNNLDLTTQISSTNPLINQPAGTYTLTVTDTNGNIASRNDLVITEPNLLVLSETHIDVDCNGANTGSIDLTVMGGTPPYTYVWSTTDTTQDLSDLTIGTYTVTVTDQNLCQDQLMVIIDQPTAITIDTVDIINVSGNGLTNGSITLNVSGGTTPYSYLWMDDFGNTLGSAINVLDMIGAGIYNVQITDASGCVLLSPDYEVIEPAPLSISVSEEPITCNGGLGMLNALVTGGVEPYIYEWQDSSNLIISTTDSTGSILAGTYNLTVTDANGNSAAQNGIVLTEPDVITISSFMITDVQCFNESNGSIALSIEGGSGNYDISWDVVNSTSSTITNLVAGDYTVTIRDQLDASCFIAQTFTVNQPEPYGIENIMVTMPSVGNSNGSISLEVFGGVAPLSFVWTDENNIIVPSSSMDNMTSINNLPEGDYTMVVTDASGFSCVLTDTYTVGLPGELLIDVTQTNPITCFQGNDGELTVTTSTGGNIFQWFDANTDIPIPGATFATLQVAAGSYYVQVTNAVFNLTEISAPITVAEPVQVVGSVSSTEATCNGFLDGSLQLEATGGSGSYEYVFRSVGEVYPTVWVPFDNGTMATIPNLPAGDYEVRIRDTQLCIYMAGGVIVDIPANIGEPELLEIDSVVITDASGAGLSNGSVVIDVIGGVEPYSYEWTDSTNTIISTTNDILDVLAGTYTVTVTDANGCIVGPVTYVVNEPNPLTVTVSIMNSILCNGDATGSIEAVAMGGVPFSNSGNDYMFEWFDALTMTSVGIGAIITNLIAGSYLVVVTDANGNTVTSTTIELTEPDLLQVELSEDYVLCGDGNDWTILSAVTGGTGTYTYNWNTGDTTPDLIDVLPGTYTLDVIDDFGCIMTETITLIPPPELVITEDGITIIPVSCFGEEDGSITVNPIGGTPPYTYLWNTGDTL